MFKRFALGSFLICSLVFSAHRAQALTLDTGLTAAGGVATYNTTRSVEDTVGLLIKVFVGLLGIVFLILTLYAGFLWMTAAGDAKKVDKAKSILTSSVIGLAICLSAYTITTFVIAQIQYTQQGTVQVPI